MARSSGPDSAGGQFFFVAGDAASNLDSDGTYVVFGRADAAVFEWLVWYNADRLHSSLGYLPPIEYEQHLAIIHQQQAA